VHLRPAPAARNRSLTPDFLRGFSIRATENASSSDLRRWALAALQGSRFSSGSTPVAPGWDQKGRQNDLFNGHELAPATTESGLAFPIVPCKGHPSARWRSS
jgi:hypothetical protein